VWILVLTTFEVAHECFNERFTAAQKAEFLFFMEELPPLPIAIVRASATTKSPNSMRFGDLGSAISPASIGLSREGYLGLTPVQFCLQTYALIDESECVETREGTCILKLTSSIAKKMQ
jgi:hypothetical protein